MLGLARPYASSPDNGRYSASDMIEKFFELSSSQTRHTPEIKYYHPTLTSFPTTKPKLEKKTRP